MRLGINPDHFPERDSEIVRKIPVDILFGSPDMRTQQPDCEIRPQKHQIFRQRRLEPVKHFLIRHNTKYFDRCKYSLSEPPMCPEIDKVASADA